MTSRRGTSGRKLAKTVKAAKQRGIAVINSGAGPPPVDAPAPHGGTRYSLLVDPPGSPSATWGVPHDGTRDETGKLVFADAPTFRPLLTPAECLRAGVFGGCYFNPRGGKPGVFGRDVDVDPAEFPEWFAGLPDRGTPRGATTWCSVWREGWPRSGFLGDQGLDACGSPRLVPVVLRFFQGRARRTTRKSRDGRRAQVSGALEGQLWQDLKATASFDDPKVSPVIRQTLLHWAYELSERDWHEEGIALTKQTEL